VATAEGFAVGGLEGMLGAVGSTMGEDLAWEEEVREAG
jgi:hypothetical protein